MTTASTWRMSAEQPITGPPVGGCRIWRKGKLLKRKVERRYLTLHIYLIYLSVYVEFSKKLVHHMDMEVSIKNKIDGLLFYIAKLGWWIVGVGADVPLPEERGTNSLWGLQAVRQALVWTRLSYIESRCGEGLPTVLCAVFTTPAKSFLNSADGTDGMWMPGIRCCPTALPPPHECG